MTKKKKTKGENEVETIKESILVIVRENAFPDIVKLGEFRITKSEAVEVPAQLLENKKQKQHLKILN